MRMIVWIPDVCSADLFGGLVDPLAADQSWANSRELNGAGSLTDYSTSGTVTSWKVGGTWEVNGDIRFRATRSRDIRAPSMAELFSGATTAQFSPFDPVINQSYSVQTLTRGNGSRSEEHTSELQSLMRISYAVFCLTKKK